MRCLMRWSGLAVAAAWLAAPAEAVFLRMGRHPSRARALGTVRRGPLLGGALVFAAVLAYGVVRRGQVEREIARAPKAKIATKAKPARTQ